MIPRLHNFTAKRCVAGLFNSILAAPTDGVPLEVVAPSIWVRAAAHECKNYQRTTCATTDKERQCQESYRHGT
jgi:hypothetical protein